MAQKSHGLILMLMASFLDLVVSLKSRHFKECCNDRKEIHLKEPEPLIQTSQEPEMGRQKN